jgi:hypothetical protein
MGGGVAVSFYTGAPVSRTFTQRWRSREHVGPARPWMQVQLRRGQMQRSYHYNWPNPQFGQVIGQSIRRQWYPDWTALTDWVTLDTVAQVDLDQSFDNNGVTVATIDLDNVEWQQLAGHAGMSYHARQRGVYWPWRGWRPPRRPGSGDARNEWWDKLPNAQIVVRQGYGPDTAVKTFTGLVDSFNSQVRPDRITVTARDFGGVLADCPLFGWNKDRMMPDPVTFVPWDYHKIKLIANDARAHRWIRIKDSVDIVKCVLRWAGFKEWEVEDSGVNISTTVTFDKAKTYMDVINAVKEQLGYIFFIGEPTSDDLSIGVPIFRRGSVMVSQRSRPIAIRDKDLLTDIKPQHDNKDDRHIIRVRGTINKQDGATLGQGVARIAGQDQFRRNTFVYIPPFGGTHVAKRMAGVLKQFTYYNLGDQSVLGFTSNRQCAVAAVLIAIQIGLARDTGTLQTPGNPAFGLDSFAFLTDAGSGVASRLYVSNRKSTMTIGGDGSSQQKSPYGGAGGSSTDLVWATEIGGSLCDNPEMETMVTDYNRALQLNPDGSVRPGHKALSAGGV